MANVRIYQLTQADALTDTTELPEEDSSNGNLTRKASMPQISSYITAQNSPRLSVIGATTAACVGTYNNGTAGVGATFTFTATGAQGIDDNSIELQLGTRWLMKNQSNARQNGIYVVTTAGSPGVQCVSVRASDFDNSQPGNCTEGVVVAVVGGTTNGGTQWITNLAGNPYVIGTDPITWGQIATTLPINSVNPVYIGGAQGSDTPGNGSIGAPYATPSFAETQITDASSVKVYTFIFLSDVSDAAITLKPFINYNLNGFTLSCGALSIDSSWGTSGGACTFSNGGLDCASSTLDFSSFSPFGYDISFENIRKRGVGDITIVGIDAINQNSVRTYFNGFNDAHDFFSSEGCTITISGTQYSVLNGSNFKNLTLNIPAGSVLGGSPLIVEIVGCYVKNQFAISSDPGGSDDSWLFVTNSNLNGGGSGNTNGLKGPAPTISGGSAGSSIRLFMDAASWVDPVITGSGVSVYYYTDATSIGSQFVPTHYTPRTNPVSGITQHTIEDQLAGIDEALGTAIASPLFVGAMNRANSVLVSPDTPWQVGIFQGNVVATTSSFTSPTLLTVGGGGLTIDFSVTGANGSRTGSIAANTWYTISVIGDSTGSNPVAGFADTGATPTLPAGYDVYKIVGTCKTETGSTTIRNFNQIGYGNDRETWWEDGSPDSIILSAGNSTTPNTNVFTSAAQPQVVNSQAVYLEYEFIPATTGNTFTLQPFNVAGTIVLGGGSAGVTDRGTVKVITTNSQQLGYNVSNASDSLSLNVLGYVENL